MKARIIVTKKCNRNCEGCCNDQDAYSKIDQLKDDHVLLSFKEIMVTGGEPMLIPDKIIQFLHSLREIQKYTGKIYIYTALYNKGLFDAYSWASKYVDRINFTMHNNSTDQDVRNLKLLSAAIQKLPSAAFRLSIDSRLYERYDFCNIDFSYWSVVRKMKWQDNCKLPEGEKLFIYEL